MDRKKDDWGWMYATLERAGRVMRWMYSFVSLLVVYVVYSIT
jgi:hypothetical protein